MGCITVNKSSHMCKYWNIVQNVEVKLLCLAVGRWFVILQIVNG